MEKKTRIIWYDELDSTNNEALRQILTLDNLSVLAARAQTAGRGQRGNRWCSEPGENLTFSVLLKFGEGALPPLPAHLQFNLTCVATLAVWDYLHTLEVETRIKWPNDIYAGDRKICGMLIENGLSGASLTHSVIGIGLNLNQTVFPGELVNPTSVARLTGQRHPLAESLERFLGHFESRLNQLYNTESLRTSYLKHLYRLGEACGYVDCATGESFSATITGLTPEGRLCLALPDGTVRHYAFKEVSYLI